MITAQLATIPGRINSMLKTVRSLLPQADNLNVVCNNYSEHNENYVIAAIKDWQLYHNFNVDGLLFYNRQNQRGDAEKFYNVPQEGYVLTCDDDIIYPPDYVEKMINAVDSYGGHALVSLHGRELRKGRIGSYYSSASRTAAFRCTGDVGQDHRIENGTIGTGVLAWNADKVKVSYDWFESANMADIWLAVNARRLEIPMVVIAHSADWLKVGYDGEDTIWHKHHQADAEQTRVWNKQFEI